MGKQYMHCEFLFLYPKLLSPSLYFLFLKPTFANILLLNFLHISI